MSSVVSDPQISLKWCRRHLLPVMQSAVSCSELYFARCCALKRAELLQRKVRLMYFF